MFWHLRQLFLNLFIIYEKHILNYSGGVFKGVFKGVHFQNEKCDCIKYLKLVEPCGGSGRIQFEALKIIPVISGRPAGIKAAEESSVLEK